MHQPSRPSMVRSHRLVVALAALTSLVGQAASATTLVNGSLESPSASFIQTVAAGQSANGWSVIDLGAGRREEVASCHRPHDA